MFAQEQQVVRNQKYVVSSYSLNIREKASITSPIVGYLQKGNEVNGLKEVINKNGYAWIKIDRGYISKCSLTKNELTMNCYYPDKRGVDNTGKYFIGLSAGKTQISSKYNEVSGSFSPISCEDEDGLTLSFETGYNIDSKLFVMASYNRTKLDDVTLYNYLVSINKRFISAETYNIYIGAVGGISYIKVLDIPVANYTKNDDKKRACAYGIQVGVEKDINDNIVFFTQYQYLKAEHTTILRTATTETNVIQDNFNNVNFGVRFKY